MNRKENGITNPRFTLRPASSGETNLFYALSKDLDEKLGTVGHLRIDFGSNGHEFWHTWWPRDYERPYSSDFESDLKMVVDALRDDGPLESFSAMQQYCAGHSGKIEGGWQQNYGYVINGALPLLSALQSCLRGLPGILNGIWPAGTADELKTGSCCAE